MSRRCTSHAFDLVRFRRPCTYIVFSETSDSLYAEVEATKLYVTPVRQIGGAAGGLEAAACRLLKTAGRSNQAQCWLDLVTW